MEVNAGDVGDEVLDEEESDSIAFPPPPKLIKTPILGSTTKLGSLLPKKSEISDITKSRNDLSTQVQIMQQQQEAKMHNLESQINEMEKKLQPDIQKLEHSQEEAINQLNRIKDKISQIQEEEVIPLKAEYEKLSTNFDRFIRQDVDAKINPMKDDVREAKSKIQDLSATTDTSFARIDESLKAISEKIEATGDNLRTQQTKVNYQLDDLIPKVGSLENKVMLLNNLVEDSPQLASGVSSLSGTLQKSKDIIKNLTEDVIPTKVDEAKKTFDDAMTQLEEYCTKRVANIKLKLTNLKEESDAITQNRRKAIETMAHLLQSSEDAKEKLKNLQDNIKVRLLKLNSEMESSLSGTNERVKNLASETENSSSSMEAKVDCEIGNRKKQVEVSIRKLQESMKRDYAAGEKAQNIAIARITELRDALEGDNNCIGRLKDIRLKVKSSIDTIMLYNQARIEEDQNGTTPLQIAVRLSNIEERIKAAEERLHDLDGKSPNKKPYTPVIAIEKIDDIPEIPKPGERKEPKQTENNEEPISQEIQEANSNEEKVGEAEAEAGTGSGNESVADSPLIQNINN